MEEIHFSAADGVDYIFTNAESLFQHVHDEFGFWTWLNEFNSGQPGSQLWSKLEPLQSASTSADQKDVEACKRRYQDFLTLRPALHMKSVGRSFIEAIKNRSKHEALYALAAMFRSVNSLKAFDHSTGRMSDMVLGTALGAAFANETHETLTSAWQKVMENIRSDFEASLSRARGLEQQLLKTYAQISELAQTHTKQVETLEAESRQQVKHFTDAMENQRKEAEDKLASEWGRIADTYDNQLALEAPSKYWQAKKKSHTKWIAVILPVTIGVAACGGYLMIRLAWIVFQDRPVSILPSWYQVVGFSVGALMYLWTVRSLLRFVLSHVHLALDAAERHTMIVSYLALTRRQGLPDSQLDKVFAAIFRPTGDGIVKEEGIPWPSVIADALKTKP